MSAVAHHGLVVDMKDVESYRRQAAVCREEANKACGPISAAGWLQLADDFEELAFKAQRLSRLLRYGLTAKDHSQGAL
jgi:hypothetical protein